MLAQEPEAACPELIGFNIIPRPLTQFLSLFSPHKVINWRTGAVQTVSVHDWQTLSHFTQAYPTATALVIFLAMVTILLLAFQAYHIIHILQVGRVFLM